MSCTSLPRKPSLLSLPSELRFEIWTIFYTAVCPPRIIYHEDHHKIGGTTRKHFISFAIASSCKALHAEIWPFIWSHTELHLTRDLFAWYHHELPPAWQRKKIRHIVWYMTVDCRGESNMLPEAPLPLWKFPALESFKLCAALWAEMNEMPPVESYRLMRPEDRIAQWRSVPWMDGECLIQRILRIFNEDYDIDLERDWLWKLLRGDEFDVHVTVGTDNGVESDQRDDDDDDDDDGLVFEEALDLLAMVAQRLRITVQIELSLSAKGFPSNHGYDKSQDVAKLPVFCIVDASSRKIVEMSQPTLQEYKDSNDLAMVAVWDWPW